MQELIGQVLGGCYRVDRYAGRGGMAEVYRVWDQKRAVYLALKLLHHDLCYDAVFLRRFKREAQTLAKLQHPNIVRFYGLEQDGVRAFILMDYVEGHNLGAEIIRSHGNGGLGMGRVLQVIQPICRALHYAHGMGMVHCDIKPANIMIHNNGTVMVCDFGIARHAEGATTSTMLGAGTPAYMAPEQVRGLDPVPQTDIYALGIVLYEMLTGGERPFIGELAAITGSITEKVRWEQCYLAAPSPRRYNPAITSEVAGVVLHCLEKEPEMRYDSALEVYNALINTLEREDIPEVAEEEPTQLQEILEGSPSKRCEKCGETYNVNETDCPICREQEISTIPEDEKPEMKEGPLPSGKGERKPKNVLVLATVVGMVVLLIWGGASMKRDGEGEGALAEFVATNTATMIGTLTATETAMQTYTPAATETATRAHTPTVAKTVQFTNTPHVINTPELGIGSIMVSEIDGMEMVYVPSGEFEMGSVDADEEAYYDEKPQHTVNLNAYWIDRTEVTNAMYAAFLKEEGNQSEGGETWLDIRDKDVLIVQNGGNWQPVSGYEDHPVIEVSWYGAQAYCEWAGRRLPSEAEWEKAARGTYGRVYPWGNGNPLGNLLNYSGENDGYEYTAPVGSYPDGASPYGALDMAGNVWEWVNDRYDTDYYSRSVANNPQGPANGEYRVLRGGSWVNNEDLVRSAYRRHHPDGTNHYSGFRCAASY